MVPGVTTHRSLAPVRDRCLPVDDALVGLFPEGGLRRGHTIGCSGPAAVSLAATLVARPVAAGSWVAVVGMPMVGIEAMAGLGVSLERVVAIDGGGLRDWADRVAAAADGFELVLTRPPAGADRYARRIGQRLQVRGSVLIPVGPTRPGLPCEVELATAAVSWSGLAGSVDGTDRTGAGHLTDRQVTVRATGRRVPRPVEVGLWLPGRDGRVGRRDEGAVVLERVG